MDIPIELDVAKAPRALLPVEIYQLILSKADFLTQIRLRRVNKRFHVKLEIHDFNHIEDKYRNKLTDKILRSYPSVTKLFAAHNREICNINHLTKLQILNATGSCGVTDATITNLNLIELIAWDNTKITNVNHMTRLEILDAGRGSGIGNDGIVGLDLKVLNVSYNENITNISHLTNLEVLWATGSTCGIADPILNTKLIVLEASHNPNITDINYLTGLKLLHAYGKNCGVTTEGVSKLKTLRINRGPDSKIKN